MRAVSVDERIQVLDVARGLAVLGILVVNIRFYSSSLQAIQWGISLWPQWWNEATETLIDMFVSGKFLSVFAFLFGYGMIIIRDRVEERGRSFTALYIRRLMVLAAFGLIHGLFIWFGDILFHYALLGFVLLLFHKAKPRTLLVGSVILLSLLPALVLLGGAGTEANVLDSATEAMVREWIAHDEAVYSGGSYAEIQRARLMDWNASAMNQVVFYPQILGLFLLGAYFANRRLLHDVKAARGTLVNIVRWTGGAGLALTMASNAVPGLAAVAGGPVIGLFYVTALGVLLTHPVWQRRLMPLAFVGRMAFTNYIMQSVVCTLIFYGYGLGLYGQVGPLVRTVLAVSLFLLQVRVSGAWFKRFRMGPMEWLWRRMTYLSVPETTRA